MNAILPKETIGKFWDDSIIPALSEFIKIPAVSINYDHDWKNNGHLEHAVSYCKAWAEGLNISGLSTEVVTLDGHAPLLYLEVSATGNNLENDTLFFGHLDKMPEGAGWSDGFTPWEPVIKNNRIYGRASADNGFGFFTVIGALKLIQDAGLSHPRCVFLFETAEESGSIGFDLYLKKLQSKLGKIKVIISPDSSCSDYKRVWCGYSTRGLLEGSLTVEVLEQNRHSGAASGIVATPFRVLRLLLERIEDTKSGKIKIKELLPKNLTPALRAKIKSTAKVIGKSAYQSLGLKTKVKPVSQKVDELILNNTWMPTLCITGADYLPTMEKASATLLSKITVAFSVRLPPSVATKTAENAILRTLTKNAPYGANVSVRFLKAAAGWATTDMAEWLEDAIATGSKKYFGLKAEYNFIGGSLGLLPSIAAILPRVPVVLTGVQGSDSSTHGPNESLNLDAAKKFNGFVCYLLNAIANQKN